MDKSHNIIHKHSEKKFVLKRRATIGKRHSGVKQRTQRPNRATNFENSG